MKFTEFKTSAIILSTLGGAATIGLYFLPAIPTEAFWAIAGLYVGGVIGVAKDLVTSPAGDTEMYRVVMRLIEEKSNE